MQRPMATTPTLLIRPTTACPRCDDTRVVKLAHDIDGAFAWHECADCSYLWATPFGWTPAEGMPLSIRGE